MAASLYSLSAPRFTLQRINNNRLFPLNIYIIKMAVDRTDERNNQVRLG